MTSVLARAWVYQYVRVYIKDGAVTKKKHTKSKKKHLQNILKFI